MHNEPLLLRFAEPLSSQDGPILRFDPVRQISEVNENGTWVPGWKNSDLMGKGQTKTAVNTESTDWR
jgi:hypothetical protein